MLIGARQSTPVDLAAFRIDFSDWLGRLSRRGRQIALSLAAGERTSVVAKENGLSPARISQIRQELAVAWRTFQGELKPEASCS
jgi:hypothetical protein